MSSSQIPVAVLGATGSVGQRFISLLDNHPWFKVVALAASDRSVGQKYSQAARWVLDVPMPEYAREMEVVPASTDCIDARIVFSALHTEIANELEPQFAKAGAQGHQFGLRFHRPTTPFLFLLAHGYFLLAFLSAA